MKIRIGKKKVINLNTLISNIFLLLNVLVILWFVGSWIEIMCTNLDPVHSYELSKINLFGIFIK